MATSSNERVDDGFLSYERMVPSIVWQLDGFIVVWLQRKHVADFFGVESGLLPVVEEANFAVDHFLEPDHSRISAT